MSKELMVENMRERAEFSTKAQAEEAYDAIIGAMAEELGNGGSVTLRNFGTFTVTTRKARKGRNPRTGEAIDIPASKAVKFKPGKELEEAAAAIKAGWGVDWVDYRMFQRSVSRQLADIKAALDVKGLNKDKLGELYDDAMRRYKEFSFSGGKAWEEMRKGFTGAFNELKTAFQKARERF